MAPDPQNRTELHWQPTAEIQEHRGSAHLVDNGGVLYGDRDIVGDAISTATLASRRTTGTAWTGGTRNARVWTGSSTAGPTGPPPLGLGEYGRDAFGRPRPRRGT